jgi:tetratricopeptide (TPR) repeat protein
MALQGLDEARRLGLRAVEALLLNVLSIAAERKNELVGSLELTRQNLQILRETGDRVNEAIGLKNLGGGWLTLGDLVPARRDLDAALQMLRANGDRVIEGAALIRLSELALWQGQEARALALARRALDIALAAQARDIAVAACLQLGNAELALGRVAEARQAYTQAHAGALEIGSALHRDASAGLARVALTEGNTAAALAELQPLQDHVAAGGTLDGIDEPRLIELTCYQALTRAGDPSAADWLARAHTALMAQADTISRHSTDPALRHGYLHNIPHHREIVKAWAKRMAAAGAPNGSNG